MNIGIPHPIMGKSHLIPAVLFFILIGLIPDQGLSQKNERSIKLEPVKVLPVHAKRYALVIGVDQYADTQITTLGGASNDAKTLANALIQYAAFPSEQVTLLASDQPAERQPTRGNMF